MKRLHRIAALLAATLAAAAAEILAAPTVISACTTITTPGSYVLGGNLSTSGDCIRILADSVTLDFDGHLIKGNGTGFGVSGHAGPVGITVRNGTVTNFMNGVSFGASTNVVVERMHVIGNTNVGIAVWHGIVRDNVVARHPNHAGISIGEHAVVTGNLVMDGVWGVLTTGASTISGNVLASNRVGVWAWIGESTISGNTIYGGSVGTVGIDTWCPSALLGNTVTSHSTANLSFLGSTCTAGHNAAP